MKSFLSLVIILSLTGSVAANNNSFLFHPEGANFYIYGYGQSTFIINQSKLTELNIDKQISQLVSSKRINSPSDDPAGFAVAEKMNSLLNQLRQESMNAEDMRNFHYYVETAIAEDQELLKRIRLLTVQASNGILNNEDRDYIQNEIKQFLSQINLNAKFLQFNSISVIPDLTTGNLGLDGIDVIHNAENSMGIIDDVLIKLTKKRIIQGVDSNILTFRIEGKKYQYLNLQRTESLISDLDMSEGISNLIKNSVLLKTQNGLILKSR